MIRLVTCSLLLAPLLVVVTACDSGRKSGESTLPTSSVTARPAAFSLPASRVRFAGYAPVGLLRAGRYSGPATPHSLAGVQVAPELRRALRATGANPQLAENGFVVVPAKLRLFQQAYEGNVYGGWPVFVTTDVAYHEWHLLFDKVLRDLEQQVLLPKLDKLVAGSLQAAHAQRAELDGTPVEDAAARVEQLFEVAAAELGQPVRLGRLAASEKALVDAHAETVKSPLLDVRVDYSLFTPRGHYTRTAELTRYFRAMSVLGQLPSCLPGTLDCPGPEQARIGILAARTLAGHPKLVALWRAVYEPTAFLVGRADDYTPLEVDAAAEKADAGLLRDASGLADDATVAKVLAALVAARPVLIDPEKASIRFMGTRFVVDSYVLDQLVWPNVGTKTKPRLTPSGLDLVAAFGSNLAFDTLRKTGATDYAHYDNQLAKVRKAIADRPPAAWGSTVYDAWLAALEPVFAVHGTAFPDFMRSPLWAAKDFQAGLGSYTELKHDTVLYTKQFVAEGGEELPPLRTRNWVEPDPVVFGRLAAMADLLRLGLRGRSLLTPPASRLLHDETRMFRFFERIARDELAGRPLSARDNERLRFIGSEFEALWWRTSDTVGNVPAADEADAVIADIGSSAKSVLEVATGRVDRIYVLVPDGKGGFAVAAGGVYSYYEFTTPPGQRLDDAAWRTQLDRGTEPKRPAWEGAFMARG